MVKHLLGKWKALSSNTSPAKTKKLCCCFKKNCYYVILIQFLDTEISLHQSKLKCHFQEKYYYSNNRKF
jgi:hypothetical protein